MVALLRHPRRAVRPRTPPAVDLAAGVVEVVLARDALGPASGSRHSRSPMNAPRALPIVSGPVGLADTNSTFTDRGRIGATRPTAPGPRRMPSIVSSRTRSDRRRLMNPGRGDVRGRDRAVRLGLPRRTGVGDRLGDGERRPAQRAGQLHRQVRGESPCSAGRPLDLDGRASAGMSGRSPAARCGPMPLRSFRARARARFSSGGGARSRSDRRFGVVAMGRQCYAVGVFAFGAVRRRRNRPRCASAPPVLVDR